MILPWGPDPWTRERSMRLSPASLRARGEAFVFPSVGGAMGATAGALVSVCAAAGFEPVVPGLGALPPARSGAMSSAASAITAISPPMGALPPSGTTILRRMPESYASSSMSALSDSISTRISPCLTFSPSFRSHFRMTPSSMVSLSFGMRTLVAIALSLVNHDRELFSRPH